MLGEIKKTMAQSHIPDNEKKIFELSEITKAYQRVRHEAEKDRKISSKKVVNPEKKFIVVWANCLRTPKDSLQPWKKRKLN